MPFPSALPPNLSNIYRRAALLQKKREALHHCVDTIYNRNTTKYGRKAAPVATVTAHQTIQYATASRCFVCMYDVGTTYTYKFVLATHLYSTPILSTRNSPEI